VTDQTSSSDSCGCHLFISTANEITFYFLVFWYCLFPVYGLAQNGLSPASGSMTTEPTKISSSQTSKAQSATDAAPGAPTASSTELSQIVVVGRLDTVQFGPRRGFFGGMSWVF
jgi:hypothetical protein